MLTWLLLSGAILCEVTGTMALRSSDGLTRPVPSVITAVGYLASFGMLSQVLRLGMPVGIAYGVWAAVGVMLVAILGRILYGEALTSVMIAGFALIAAGVALVELGAPHTSGR
jgi:small multidrug resistance pump